MFVQQHALTNMFPIITANLNNTLCGLIFFLSTIPYVIIVLIYTCLVIIKNSYIVIQSNRNIMFWFYTCPIVNELPLLNNNCTLSWYKIHGHFLCGTSRKIMCKTFHNFFDTGNKRNFSFKLLFNLKSPSDRWI